MIAQDEGTQQGIVFDIDHFSVHDGPGIRTVVYLKGCPLRCQWCHSPESHLLAPEPIRMGHCKRCAACEGPECPHGAWALVGRQETVAGVMAEVMPNKPFFDSSGGGVTLSGGETLMQPAFALALLRGFREAGVHTIVETSGMGAWDALASYSPFTDIFFYDVKTVSAERHLRFTGADNCVIQENLTRLAKARGAEGIVLRVPLIPGHTDSDADVEAVYGLALALGLRQVHLLPYNTSAAAKYEWLGRDYPLPGLARQSASYLAELVALAPLGLEVTVQ